MEFVEYDPTEWARQVRRVLIIGGPDSRKTTSIIESAPRPLHLLNMPGEKGTASIAGELADVKVYVPRVDPEKPDSARIQYGAVVRLTKDILSGKRGPVKSFAPDGLHKLYQIIYDMHFEELCVYGEERGKGKFHEEDVRGKAYGYAHKTFLDYLTLVNQSGVEYVFATIWAAKERDDPTNPRSGVHWLPDLPGQLQQWILGEFAVKLHARVGLPQPDGSTSAIWILRPTGDVWGVGVKAPLPIAKRLPASVPHQDWKKLEPILLGQVEAKPATKPLAPPVAPTSTQPTKP